MKLKKINEICFSGLLVILFIASFFQSRFHDIEKHPWHMKPWKNIDSLSFAYKTDYAVLEDSSAVRLMYDTIPMVLILIDAWGLPLNEELFKKDLEPFEPITKKKVLIHPRSRNQNKYVEQTELNGLSDDGLFIFGGDSMEYNRKDYIPKLGFSQTIFCQGCPDKDIAGKMDSILKVSPEQKLVAWTTQSSRDGDVEKLRESLAVVAELAKKHPERMFVIQGTHRPILGTPETRKRYYAHWVPVVVLN